MANPQATIQRAFSGGELAPALYARADQVKYTTGLRQCRNFMVQRHGGVTNRPGTRYVNACKTNSINVGLMRYVSEVPGQSVLIEVGNAYLRFYVNGAQLAVDPLSVAPYAGGTTYQIGDLALSGGVIYYSQVKQIGVAPPGATWVALAGNLFELPSPFGANLPNWNQSGRTLTLTHHLSHPYELINGGAITSWILRPVTTVSDLAAPAGLAVVPTAAGTLKIGYLVTAVNAAGDESGPSAQVINAAVVAPTAAAPDGLSWAAVTGATGYNVYQDPNGGGTYGLLGSTTGATAYNAVSITPDFLQTPPVPTVRFNAAGDYPDRSGNFQQRRFFGFTDNKPDGIFGSKTGLLSNFDVSVPLQNDDAVSFAIAGNNHHPVRHLLGLKGLCVLTDSGEWTVTGDGPGQPITPSAINTDQQGYMGASGAVPVVIGNSIIYVQARGKTLRDIQFDLQVEGLGGRDLSIFSEHLFKKFLVTEIDYQQIDNSVVWCCRDDGTLLGLTYVREQDVLGWHRHDSGAFCRFEHVCVVPEFDEDVVYFITRRTIGGVFHRSIERFANRVISTFNTDAWFVDFGLAYSGAPATNVAGLGHLEGQVVSVVGDGAVIFDGDPTNPLAATNYTVTGGTLNHALPAAYSNIIVGLRITADFETLDLDVQGSAIRGNLKRPASLHVLLEDSCRSFFVGSDVATLQRNTLAPYEAPANEFTGNSEMSLTTQFDDNGRIFIRHTDPLPLTILGIVPSTELGG